MSKTSQDFVRQFMFHLDKDRVILIHSLGKLYVHKIYCSRDSSEGIVTGIPAKGPWVPPSTLFNGTAVLSLAQSGLGATLTNRLH